MKTKTMRTKTISVGKVINVTGAAGVVQSFDLRTGVRKWSYKHETDPRIKGAVQALAGSVGAVDPCRNPVRSN